MRPLYKKSVIAGIRMSREIQIFFRTVYPLEFLYRSLFSLRKNVLCVARTLKDRVDVPLAAIRQILRLALGSMLQSVKKYRTYKINLLLLFSFLFMYSSSENFPD